MRTKIFKGGPELKGGTAASRSATWLLSKSDMSIKSADTGRLRFKVSDNNLERIPTERAFFKE